MKDENLVHSAFIKVLLVHSALPQQENNIKYGGQVWYIPPLFSRSSSYLTGLVSTETRDKLAPLIIPNKAS